VTVIDERAAEWNAHQRAVKVKEWLDAGERLTMAEIARRTGLTINGAKYMMAALTLVMNITEIDGEWQLVKSDCTCP
jgi:hypothetical protein